MNAIHRITGYAKRDERLAIEHDVPAEQFAEVRRLAGVPPEDAEAAGSYRLDACALPQVARRLDRTLNADAYDWYLEPFPAEAP